MIILITGSSRGIGRYLSEHYCARGDTVFGCSRSQSSFSHENYTHVVTDVTDTGALSALRGIIRKKHGTLDVLINNAGLASMNHFLLTSPEKARQLFDVNYMGVFNCSSFFVPLLKKSPHPRIINFSSIAVPLNLEGELAYVSAKAAVEAFTKVAARELAPFNITVNAIGPGPLATALTENVPKASLERLIQLQPVKRMTTFADVSNLSDFFIRPESSCVTGQIVYLGGVS